MKTPRELLLDRHRHIVPRLRTMRCEEMHRMQARARTILRTAWLGRVPGRLSTAHRACGLYWALAAMWVVAGLLEGWVFLETRRNPWTVPRQYSDALTPAETLQRLEARRQLHEALWHLWDEDPPQPQSPPGRHPTPVRPLSGQPSLIPALPKFPTAKYA